MKAPVFANDTFLYDGDCGFCTACARFLDRWVPTTAVVLPWQRADLDSLGLSVTACDDAVQWVGSDGRTVAGPAAIAELLRRSARWDWRVVGRLLGLRPVLAMAWPAYRWVSRNRHRLPGGTPACSLTHRQSSKLTV
ncbi:MAG TPA: DCC1-like thiol-disulfide oxidoreductase family protein [Micromonosporaceae bacterium]|nr:DCC1-like thiol-disulfide oxidoreductase family protein [Micromonosporaceae bacterium]